MHVRYHSTRMPSPRLNHPISCSQLQVGMVDFEAAVDRVIGGLEKKNKVGGWVGGWR